MVEQRLIEKVQALILNLEFEVSRFQGISASELNTIRALFFTLYQDIQSLQTEINRSGTETERRRFQSATFYQDFPNFMSDLRKISWVEFSGSKFFYLDFIKSSLEILGQIKAVISKFILRKEVIRVFIFEYSKKYKSRFQRKIFRENLELVRFVEEKIVLYFSNGGRPGRSNLAKIDASRKTENLHAHIPSPLDDYRILYSINWEEKKILFLDIGSHTYFGFS